MLRDPAPSESFERSHFLFARPAPAGPNVYQQRFAAEVTQMAGRSVDSLKRGVRQPLPDLVFGEFHGRRLRDRTQGPATAQEDAQTQPRIERSARQIRTRQPFAPPQPSRNLITFRPSHPR